MNPLQKRHKGQLAEEMPESQSCASVASLVAILQSARTQVCFRSDRRAVATPEQEVLWLRRPGCDKYGLLSPSARQWSGKG